MATMITQDCINCGACEPECPNNAIYQGGVEWEFKGAMHAPLAADVFYIVPEKCTECVGFFDHEACAAVCPVDVCVPNPDIPETEAQLIERARELHPGKDFGSAFPSRFRADGGTPASAGEPAAAAAPSAAAASATAPAGAAAIEPTVGLALPAIDGWEVPVDCHVCHGTYAVEFRHLRAGNVLRCPFCKASYIVTTSMNGQIGRALREFHARWGHEFEELRARRQRELQDFEDRQKDELESFNQRLKEISQSVHAPGAPRKRAWIFG
jgi:ferredoxin